MAVRVYSFDSSVCTSVCSAGTLEKGGVYAGSSSGSSGILAPAVYPVAGDAKPGDTADSGCWFYLESGPHMGGQKRDNKFADGSLLPVPGGHGIGCLIYRIRMLEAVNLAVFLLAHMRKCMRWIRISGIIMILVALYMTKDFWLSLSWWVYLLAAGLGLIVFAAVNEMKKR